jgi:hypothetical protein
LVFHEYLLDRAVEKEDAAWRSYGAKIDASHCNRGSRSYSYTIIFVRATASAVIEAKWLLTPQFKSKRRSRSPGGCFRT